MKKWCWPLSAFLLSVSVNNAWYVALQTDSWIRGGATWCCRLYEMWLCDCISSTIPKGKNWHMYGDCAVDRHAPSEVRFDNAGHSDGINSQTVLVWRGRKESPRLLLQISSSTKCWLVYNIPQAVDSGIWYADTEQTIKLMLLLQIFHSEQCWMQCNESLD